MPDTERNESEDDYGCCWVLEVRKRAWTLDEASGPATPWKPIQLYVHEDRCQRAAERNSGPWLEYRAVPYEPMPAAERWPEGWGPGNRSYVLHYYRNGRGMCLEQRREGIYRGPLYPHCEGVRECMLCTRMLQKERGEPLSPPIKVGRWAERR